MIPLFDEHLPADPWKLTAPELARIGERQLTLGEEQSRDAERLAAMVAVLRDRATVEGIVTGATPQTIGEIATPAELAELERLNALTDLREQEMTRLSEYVAPLLRATGGDPEAA